MSINESLAKAIQKEYLPQCAAKTLDGNRCLRRADSANCLCANHDPTRQCRGWNFKRDRQCGNTAPDGGDLCWACEKEHAKLGWDECWDEDCGYHNDEHVETKGRRA